MNSLKFGQAQNIGKDCNLRHFAWEIASVVIRRATNNKFLVSIARKRTPDRCACQHRINVKGRIAAGGIVGAHPIMPVAVIDRIDADNVRVPCSVSKVRQTGGIQGKAIRTVAPA